MPNSSYLMEEKNIPANLVPAPDTAPLGAPAPPAPNDMPQFFSGSMPPSLQHDVSFVGTEVGTPRIPKYSLMPFGNQSNPFTNAAIESTALKVVNTTSPAKQTDVESIATNPQSAGFYVVQLSDNDAIIPLSNNSGGTVVLPPLTRSVADVVATAQAVSSTVSVSATPIGSSDFAMVFTQQSNGAYFNPGGSWLVTNTSAEASAYYQQLSSTSPITATGSLAGGSQSWSSVLVLFASNGTSSPTSLGNIVLNGAATGFNASGTSFTAGKTGLIVFSADQVNTSSGTAISSITDSQGNVWQNAGHIAVGIGAGPGAGTGTAVDVWYALNMKGGSITTLTGNFNAPLPSGASSDGNVALFEVSGLVVPPSFANNLPAGFYTYIQNIGSGSFFAKSSALIDGSSNFVTLGPSQGLIAVWNGTYWTTERGTSGLSSPISVPQGGTGQTSLTAHELLVGEGTSSIASVPTGTSGQILTSNGSSLDPTFQDAANKFTVGSNLLIGSFTVSDSSDIRGLTVFAHLRGRKIMNACQSWSPRFVFGTSQTGPGTITMTRSVVYKMNQVDPGGNLFAPYTLSAAANASGGNTVYTGTNLQYLLPGSVVNIAGFTNSANNGTGFLVESCTTTTVTVNNSAGVVESHAATVQLSIIAAGGGLGSFVYVQPGGPSQTPAGHFNAPIDPNFDYIVAVYFAVADTPFAIIAGVANTFANDGNTLAGATASGDFTTLTVGGVMPTFTGYPTATLMHQFQVVN